MKPFWVTFYSYKGGVGRSMALVNLATLLARKGRRVFMIDFDLESPGLDSFHDLGLQTRQAGVVEYAHEFRETQVAPALEPFVQECNFKIPLRGKVWLMPSGRKDEPYNSKRVKLNWESMYDEGLGALFVENWKAAICRKYKPDYVFVDSRTGLTDIGGICTLHLPDLVVLLFGLNDQNVQGIAAVLHSIRRATKANPPQILPVATPVPNLPKSEGSLYQQRTDKAEQLLGIKIEHSISYNPEAALVEKLFTIEGEPIAVRIATEYQNLLNEIQRRDQNGLDALIRQAEQKCEDDDEPSANRIKQFLLDDFADRADALFQVGQIERRFTGRDTAAAYWRQAVELDPNHAEAFSAVATYYKQKEQIPRLLELHDIRLRYARENNPRSVPAILTKRGEDLMVLGRYPEAAQCYSEILENLPKDSFRRLVYMFNAAESSRRATKTLDHNAWRAVYEYYEGHTYDNNSVDTQANVYQAIHIAYGCIGCLDKAKEVLEKAAHCALATGKAISIFTVKTYSFVSAEEFLIINREMLDALRTGRLWDGMLLPPPSS
jgi:tetratricopeptide (TPR) repeat protein